VRHFYKPLFAFVENAMKNKQNVMIHCLAGRGLHSSTSQLNLCRF